MVCTLTPRTTAISEFDWPDASRFKTSDSGRLSRTVAASRPRPASGSPSPPAPHRRCNRRAVAADRAASPGRPSSHSRRAMCQAAAPQPTGTPWIRFRGAYGASSSRIGGHVGGTRPERRRTFALPASPPRHHRARDPLSGFPRQPGLADTRLPGQQHDAAGPGGSLCHQRIENGKLSVPAYQHARRGRTHGDTVIPASAMRNERCTVHRAAERGGDPRGRVTPPSSVTSRAGSEPLPAAVLAL